MVAPLPRKRGRPAGLRTPADLLEKAQVLREHLEQLAEPAYPQHGSRYEAYRKPLSQQLATPRRLAAWWRRESVQLTQAELDACWRWLLPQ